MLSRMRDIFKVGPSPFQIGSSFKPVVAQPIKVSRRRPSNAGQHELIESTMEGKGTQGVVASDSENEDAARNYTASAEAHDMAYRPGKDRVVQRPLDQKSGAGKGAAELGSNTKLVKSPPIIENLMEDVVRDSFVGSQDTEVSPHTQTRRAIITPPPTLKHKRRFPDSGDKLDKPTSKKRKELQESKSMTLLGKKHATVEKSHHKSSLSKSTGIPNAPAEENLERASTSPSKQQRREDRRKRKQEKAERKRKRAEREKNEVEMQHATKLAIPEAPTSPAPQNPTTTVNKERESPELEAPSREDPQMQGSQDLVLDKNSTIPGVPSRRNGAHDSEIPATQESLTLSYSAKAVIPQPSTHRKQSQNSKPTKSQNILSKEASPGERRNPEDLPNSQDALELDDQTTVPVKPLVSKKHKVEPAKPRFRQQPARSGTNRQRQFLSAEKIVDSSEDELQEPELHGSEEDAPGEGSNLRSKRRKVSDLSNLRTPVRFAQRTSPPDSPASEEDEEEEMDETRENKSGRKRRLFTIEDDEKLHRIITQFKKVFAEVKGD